MTWRVVFTATARHALKRIPRPVAFTIGEELASLAGEPDPKKFVKRLQGSQNPPFYSLRVGDYRAILSIVDDLVIIHVVDVGHRSSVYRKY
ncbi:type II toxin-antitoxin system RelE/ParE family toxin [Methanoculleus sp. FWC-SCC1]|uniref:Type II toxin-antitoxin system RelE/ParE family toxin n=1 Tax=Methanoculleus frigidifontis TaxID=2584085 RepID=A0ABT8MCP1_9EURY|nr:type II toxin-antitoxin system RelE/ParE family toxin [Methanoculleus sp. FWC-SCC1]MDN7025704.1 type II toxin-antitoxin system RelE/ParE family toxin [Methanoculleus sp. FWC-SCC1]